MSNFKVSSDIDTLLRKSTKEEVSAFLGIDTNTANIAGNADDISDNENSLNALNDENQQLGEAISTAITNIATNATALAAKAPLDSPDFTGNVEFKASTYYDTNPPNVLTANNNGYVGINTNSPNANLEVVGELRTTGTSGQIYTGDLTVNNSLYGGDLLVSDILCADLDVSGETQFGDDVIFANDASISGNVSISGELEVSQAVDCPHITATLASFAGATFTASSTTLDYDVAVESNITVDGDLKLTDGGFTKNNCYYKTKAVRLQRGSTDSDEILMRYNGPSSNDFLIQQFSGGSEKGHIKFLGNTSQGSRVRLEADQIDVGFNRSGFETNLVKIYSDTNINANKKLVFTDTRDATDGLHFNHSGAVELVQMGMYGSYGDSNVGEFKITHKDGTASNTDVLSISPTADKVKIHKPLNLQNVPVCADNTAADSAGLLEGDVYRTSTGVLMIKY